MCVLYGKEYMDKDSNVTPTIENAYGLAGFFLKWITGEIVHFVLFLITLGLPGHSYHLRSFNPRPLIPEVRQQESSQGHKAVMFYVLHIMFIYLPEYISQLLKLDINILRYLSFIYSYAFTAFRYCRDQIISK